MSPLTCFRERQSETAYGEQGPIPDLRKGFRKLGGIIFNQLMAAFGELHEHCSDIPRIGAAAERKSTGRHKIASLWTLV